MTTHLDCRSDHSTHSRIRKHRVLTNTDVFADGNYSQVEAVLIPSGGSFLGKWRRRIWTAIRSYRYDALFYNCDAQETLAVAAILRLTPFNRCSLICADLILNVPITPSQRLIAWVKKNIYRRVNLFILNQKDYQGYTDHFGVDAPRVVYVPWKVNLQDSIRTLAIEEGDFAFAGGVTLRDWDTLAEAVRGLDLPVVILIPDDAELIRRGQVLLNCPDPAQFGPNVRIVRHKGPSDWLPWVAKSRFVILPILGRSINSSGISTYLSCMAMKKCVIISEGPSTRDILSESEAVTVPPGDPAALREAILKVDRDEALRRRVADAGFAYANQCGDHVRMFRDFADCILNLITR